MKVDFSMLYFTFKGPPGENEHKTAARNSTGKTMFLPRMSVQGLKIVFLEETSPAHIPNL